MKNSKAFSCFLKNLIDSYASKNLYTSGTEVIVKKNPIQKAQQLCLGFEEKKID